MVSNGFYLLHVDVCVWRGAEDGLLVFQIKTGLGGIVLRNRAGVTPWD